MLYNDKVESELLNEKDSIVVATLLLLFTLVIAFEEADNVLYVRVLSELSLELKRRLDALTAASLICNTALSLLIFLRFIFLAERLEISIFFKALVSPDFGFSCHLMSAFASISLSATSSRLANSKSYSKPCSSALPRLIFGSSFLAGM